MTETWRLFIAINVPAQALDVIERLQAELKRTAPDRAIRWARPEGIHLTLKFLGDVPTGQLEDLQAALDAAVAGRSPFDLRVEGLGAFPNTQRPRVVWIGVEGNLKPLKTLRRRVEEHVSALGYSAEDRSFTPHLTLGRVQRGASRRDTNAIGELVESTMVEALASWRVEAVSLMRSELHPDGTVYTEVFRAPLEGEG